MRIVYKHFVVHPAKATTPALAACAAAKQGRFEKMANGIWERGYKAGRDLSKAKMLEIARSVGVRMTRFKADMDGGCAEQVRRDQSAMAQVGVAGTPAFFVNGRFLSGARPYEHFRKLIDEELAKAKGSGIPAKSYYDHIVSSGLKRLAPPPAEDPNPGGLKNPFSR